MENYAIAGVFVVLGLLLGLVVGILVTPTDTVIKEVPVTVEVNRTVEVPVQVIQEVQTERDYLSEASNDYLEELEDDLDAHQEIAKVDLDDVYSIEFGEDEYTVEFTISYRVLDDLTDTRTKVTETVRAFYEEDEDVEFTVL